MGIVNRMLNGRQIPMTSRNNIHVLVVRTLPSGDSLLSHTSACRQQ